MTDDVSWSVPGKGAGHGRDAEAWGETVFHSPGDCHRVRAWGIRRRVVARPSGRAAGPGGGRGLPAERAGGRGALVGRDGGAERPGAGARGPAPARPGADGRG